MVARPILDNRCLWQDDRKTTVLAVVGDTAVVMTYPPIPCPTCLTRVVSVLAVRLLPDGRNHAFCAECL